MQHLHGNRSFQVSLTDHRIRVGSLWTETVCGAQSCTLGKHGCLHIDTAFCAEQLHEIFGPLPLFKPFSHQKDRRIQFPLHQPFRTGTENLISQLCPGRSFQDIKAEAFLYPLKLS